MDTDVCRPDGPPQRSGGLEVGGLDDLRVIEVDVLHVGAEQRHRDSVPAWIARLGRDFRTRGGIVMALSLQIAVMNLAV